MTQPDPPKQLPGPEVPTPDTAHTSESVLIEDPTPSVWDTDLGPHAETPEDPDA